MKFLPLVLFLAGCAGPAPTYYWEGDGTGAMVRKEWQHKACSDVTISSVKGASRARECQFR